VRGELLSLYQGENCDNLQGGPITRGLFYIDTERSFVSKNRTFLRAICLRSKVLNRLNHGGWVNSWGDANDYVNSVIDTPTSVCAINGLTPSHSSQKRHLSEDLILVTKKKSKSDTHSPVECSERIIAQARRSLYGNTPAQKSKYNSWEASAHKDGLTSQAESNSVNVDMLSKLIVKLSVLLAVTYMSALIS